MYNTQEQNIQWYNLKNIEESKNMEVIKRLAIKTVALLLIVIGTSIPINPVPFALGTALITYPLERAYFIKFSNLILILTMLVFLIILGSYIPNGGAITGTVSGVIIAVVAKSAFNTFKMSTRKI